MEGGRDSDITAMVWQPDHLPTGSTGFGDDVGADVELPTGIMAAFRYLLWREHLGEYFDKMADLSSLECVTRVREMADANWEKFTVDTGLYTTTPTLIAHPDTDANVAVVIFRQEKGSDRGPRPLRSWRALYHTRIPAGAMAVYTAFVRGGDMSGALHSPVPDISAPALATASPTSGASQTSSRKSALRSAPHARASSQSWQISVSVGLVGLEAAVAILVLLDFRSLRRASHDVQSIRTLIRSPSEALSMPEYRVKPVRPPQRGHNALRHQTGIMHWQNNAAAAGAASVVTRDTSSSSGASLYATQSSSQETRSMTADSYSYTCEDDVRPLTASCRLHSHSVMNLHPRLLPAKKP
eukprot:IDg1309t1